MTTREVVLDGGSPWGFRLHGGADVNQPLRISRVNPGSKAALRGIREGDFITSINGQSTKDITNADAHALLKNSGDTLKLGLNEDTNGSPKRRQYKTVHQETHSETVKKSSITSYTLTSSKTTSQEVINDLATSKAKENSKINGQSKTAPSDHPVASQRSTLSSNCSSESSTPSTYTEGGAAIGNTSTIRNALAHTASNYQDPVNVMSDNVVSSSRSRRKRSRSRRKKTKIVSDDHTVVTELNIACSVIMEEDKEDCPIIDSPITPALSSVNVETETLTNYRVDSPQMVKEPSSKRNNGKMPPKSKSLDDDEMIKIQELSETSETEDKADSKAIISEAESDIEREPIDTNRERSQVACPSNLSLPLDLSEEMSLLSPEEELTLRNFLESLNLVNSPEDAAQQVYEKSTIEEIKARKAKKRAALEQYFFPIAQNPRFLEVINEEGSDLSDREQKSLSHHLKQGTPELEVLPPPLDALPPTSSKRRNKRQSKMESHFCAPVSNPVILVGTKIVESPGSTHQVCSSNIEQEISAEVVYLEEDSSSGETPDPKSEDEDNSDVSNKDKTDGELSSNVSSAPELTNNPAQNLETNEEQAQTDLHMASNPSDATTLPESAAHSKIAQNLDDILTSNPAHATCNDVSDNNQPENAEIKLPEEHIIKVELIQDSKSSSSETKVPKVITNLAQQSETADYKSEIFVSLKKNDFKSEAKKIGAKKLQNNAGQPALLTNAVPKEHIIKVELAKDYATSDSNVTKPTKEHIIKVELAKDYAISDSNVTKPTKSAQESEITEKRSEAIINVKKSNAVVTKTETICDKVCDTKEVYKENKLPKEHIIKIEVDKDYSKSSQILHNETSAHVLRDKTPTVTSEILSQLTPPPTPDDMSCKNDTTSETEPSTIGKMKPPSPSQNMESREVQGICENLVAPKAPHSSNVVSPPIPSPSPTLSSGRSSRSTSRSTAKYNPMSSSIADILSITKDEELLKNQREFRPFTLREICLNYLMSQPFGADMLQELADVALSIETLTNRLSAKVHTVPTPATPVDPSFVCQPNPSQNNNESFDFPVRVASSQKPNPKWVGIATDEDPRLLVCLSPTQKSELEKRRKINDEAGKLLDLHEKFISRTTSYHDTMVETKEKTANDVQISFLKDPKSSSGNVSSRLLAIIRNDESSNKQSQVNAKSTDHPHDYLYFVENDTLPRSKARENLNTNIDGARLKAKDLTEWLHLARNRSTSESDLSAAAYQYPANSQERPGNRSRFTQRRTSLPQEFYQRQMQYLLEKEREIQRELEQLEEEKRKLSAEMAPSRQFHPEDFHISRKGDFAENKSKIRPNSMPSSSTEFFRQQMYEEYMGKIAQREERKQHKVIKVTSRPSNEHSESVFETKQISGLEDEFMDKVKQKQKLGKLQPESEQSLSLDNQEEESEPVLVIDGESLKGTGQLPKHLQEFVDITKHAAEINSEDDGVWSPGQKQEFQLPEPTEIAQSGKDEPLSPVWIPKSATSSPTVERKEYKPIKFESPVLGRKSFVKSENTSSAENLSSEPPWKVPDTSSDTGVVLSSTLQKRLPTSHSSPASGFNDFTASRLPKAQNPTITLLQKAREGQLPKGASYIDLEQTNHKRSHYERPSGLGPGEIVYQIKNEYTSESDSEKPRRIVDLGPRKFEGIGPTTKDGMPLILRSEVKDANQSKWYKKMYDTIHKQRPHRDEYVTVRYKQKRGNFPYNSGYLSEPEPGAYDSDFTDYKYATLDRRRLPVTQDKENEFKTSSTMPRTTDSSNRITSSDVIRHGHDPYKNQPGRIENYRPGHSSISEKEAKEWWDEVMDIFDGHLEQQKRVPQQKSFINQALKESGYESDSTLVFRRRDDTAQLLSPQEQKEVYKVVQKGGDIPLHGFRKPAPERPKEEPELEYFPISPTLTRVRIHKNIKPQREIICYPVTIHPHPSTIFANVKRTAPSSTSNIPKPPPMPPSPPRRRSSRNNSTLRLISTMKVKTDKLPICKRHETCFTTTSDIDNTNVKYLRDKITCKLTPVSKSKDKAKLKISKTVTASPDRRSRIVSTLTTSKDPKTSLSRVQSQTNLDTSSKSADRCCSWRSQSVGSTSTQKPCRKCTSLLKKPEDYSGTAPTFGTEKKKVDLILPKGKSDKRSTLTNSPDLLSPTEVKKAVQSQAKNVPSGTVFKKSTALLASVKNGDIGSSRSATLPIKVGFSEKGKAILRSTLTKSSNYKVDKPTKRKIYSDTGKASTEGKKVISTIGRNSPPSKIVKSSKFPCSASTTDAKKLKKSKKEQINGEIAKQKKQKTLKELIFNKPTKCAGRAAGSEIVKKLKKMEGDHVDFGSTSTLTDIQKQKDAIQTDYFFQHLFLRDFASPTPSVSSRNSWLAEKTYQLQKRRSSTSEPSISAMKVYLKHTRPVTDSKFISLDLARSRSASPKSVTWESGRLQQPSEKRSSSLPPKLVFSQSSRPVSPVVEKRILKTPTPPSSPKPQKLIFSQTSRPVSPKIERRFIKSPTPPQSPRLMRSPSSRRIMQLRQSPQLGDGSYEAKRDKSPFGSRTELSLYTYPSVSQSTESIDSCDRKEYQSYIRDLLYSSRRSTRFKDLNEFYAAIEKFGQLEQTTSSIHLKPRRKFEEEIIDYDRWKEVRTREKAERELQSLAIQLKEDQKEKGFLFCPKEISRYRWRRELDRGLRVKERSVENIKEEFERLRREDSDLEIKRKQELVFLKDTYKPLWRGSSVLNLANRMVERRSQSESRVATTRQKLIDSERILTHGIGSRIWSSLSMEQVNILKNQLSEIYTQNFSRQGQDEQLPEYSIEVPKERSYNSSPLKVRRYSDTSDRVPLKIDDGLKSNFLSESDKMMLSQTISKEVLDHMTKRKKIETALPLVLGKETRGAIAAAEANLKPSDSLSHLSTFRSKPDSEDKSTVKFDDRNDESKPQEALIKTDALSSLKNTSTSETESGTDESTKTVIYAGDKNEIKKKVEYFENAAEMEKYMPVIYKPSESHDDTGDAVSVSDKSRNVSDDESPLRRMSATSQSYQDLKELFGEKDLAKYATVPLSATRKPVYTSPQRPQLRHCNLRTPSPPISETTSNGSFNRSRSLSPRWDEPLALVKAGEVRRLKHRFEYVSGTYPPRISFAPRRCSSDSNLFKRKQIVIPGSPFGDVEFLKSRYEYPVHVGRGRSRTRRGGVVSPTFLRPEDRFMPHINIISKIASLYAKKQDSSPEKSTSTEELARILGCPVGEVEKIRQKFDACGGNISLLGHMFTSSPNIRELRDIAPYLAASWIAHRYPRSEDNTRSLSSPETSGGSRDTSLVLRNRQRPKSTSPPRLPKKSSILKTHYNEKGYSDKAFKKFDPKTQPLCRYQPEPVRYKSWWTSTHTRPSVSFQEPEPPAPPPKGHHGLRNPQRPESPRKYVENEVTIHYKTPVRQEIKEYLSEDELAYRQAEAMKKIYQEERRRKYLQVSKSLQELQDINSRRHTDNFIPSQKSPIPLNRYDDFETLPAVKPRPRSPDRRLMARALYNFVGQTARELTFRKGDLIYVRRQVDKNWYEGELNAMVGLFPVNYVEIVTHDAPKSTPRKVHEGQARAKFNFVAQTHLELSLLKGELVVITRRVDDNWFEGKIGGRKGIFPVSYVDVLIDPSDPAPPTSKPVASPAAHSLLLNGSSGGKESMGSHSYTPSLSANQLTSSYHAKPVQVTGGGNYGSLNRNGRSPINQALHIETQSEPVPYRALYKYVPQNDDELELLEGDTVYVLEKCDDGWYVGSSERTGAFGTFPGNYVEKI